MEKVFHTVGPTQLYPEVKGFIADALRENIPSLSHRSQEFMDIYRETDGQLRKLLGIPEGFRIFFLSSGTECMERIIQNLVEKKSFHFVDGSFSKRFYTIAKQLGKDAGKAEVEFGKGFDFENVNIPGDAEIICLTQNETSTGVALNMEDIYQLKGKYPDMLIALDIVTGVPYIKIDFDKIDCAFFSVQKGFGLPGGLGVIIANEKCIDKAKELMKKGIIIGSYHNFVTLAENVDKFQTAITPNVMNIYLLGRVCQKLNEKGMRRIRQETEEKAKLLYDFLDSSDELKPFVKEVKDRSQTTIVIDVPEGNSKEYRDKLASQGIIAGSGYKEYKDKQIRIGNFPMHTRENIEKIISILKEQ